MLTRKRQTTPRPHGSGEFDAVCLPQAEEPQRVARAGLLPAAARPAALAQTAVDAVAGSLPGGRGGGVLLSAARGATGAGRPRDERSLHRSRLRTLSPG